MTEGTWCCKGEKCWIGPCKVQTFTTMSKFEASLKINAWSSQTLPLRWATATAKGEQTKHSTVCTFHEHYRICAQVWGCVCVYCVVFGQWGHRSQCLSATVIILNMSGNSSLNSKTLYVPKNIIAHTYICISGECLVHVNEREQSRTDSWLHAAAGV